ncbi:hypothetical protein ABC766_00525 [Methylobacterium fujisawaense]|jgi:hypothetical protein|uniref:hypothetical protein n=1 Tax=Methylobacterium fujisawaense TaxID=107400 RepID=UPI0031F4A317
MTRTANIHLHTETFTKRHECGTVSKNVIKVERIPGTDNSVVTILTDERTIGEHYSPIVVRMIGNKGRDGMLWNLHTARKNCEERGYQRAA